MVRKNLKEKISYRRRFTLRSILILFFSILIISVVCFISLYSTYFFSESMTRKIAESRRDVLIQVSDDVINIRENAESNFELYWYNCFVSLQYIESEYELVERFLNIGTMFYKTNDMSNDNYEYVFVLDSGFSYASNGNHEAYSLEEYRREVWYLDLLENTDRAIWVSTYEDDANEGDYIISLVRPMLDEEDHIVGLFLLNISEEVIYNTYANIIGDNEIYIIDKEGRIFSHSNKDMLGILFYDMDTFNSMFEDEETGNYNEYQIIAKSGEDVLFSKLTPDGQEWTFVEEIPLNIVLADVTRLTNSLKICAVISVFIALVAIFLISHYMTKPLKELVKQLELVGRDTSDETHFHVTGWEEVHKICDECNFMDQRIRNLIFEVQESERDKSKAELGFLQAQMSPHFMYNTLFSIKCLVDMDDKEGAIDTLNSFTAILKYILSYSSEYVTVSEEIVLLEDYVKLQKVLYGDRFDLEIHCHPDLYNKNILRMIIQPLVENSLQHGIAGDKSQVIVDVTFQIELEQLCIYVVDDGVGFNNYNLEKLYKKVDKIVDKIEESKEHASSNLIGLNNIRQRIKKRYGEEYGIFIDSNYEDGARIIVKLPKEIGDE